MVGNVALELNAPHLTHLVLGGEEGCVTNLLLSLAGPHLTGLDLSFARLPLARVEPLLKDLGRRLPPGLDSFSLACDILSAPHDGLPYAGRPWLAAPLQRCARLQTLAVEVSGKGWGATEFSDVLRGALGAPPETLRSFRAERVCPDTRFGFGFGNENDICDGFSGAALDSFAKTFPLTHLRIARRM